MPCIQDSTGPVEGARVVVRRLSWGGMESHAPDSVNAA